MFRHHFHQIEQFLVMLFGFFSGATLAMFVARGDVLMWIVAGAVLSVFARAFFITNFGGEWHWPYGHAGEPIEQHQP